MGGRLMSRRLMGGAQRAGAHSAVVREPVPDETSVDETRGRRALGRRGRLTAALTGQALLPVPAQADRLVAIGAAGVDSIRDHGFGVGRVGDRGRGGPSESALEPGR
jgi:hypothetical protein